ncbi:DUF4190 domain-containing protein [Streptomyces huasconensis]|uniref:DUF4190 domain-containing protein n=1 Tax=Streptomyces huasconensis TaxID=1854574 RepID=UPI0036FBB505
MTAIPPRPDPEDDAALEQRDPWAPPPEDTARPTGTAEPMGTKGPTAPADFVAPPSAAAPPSPPAAWGSGAGNPFTAPGEPVPPPPLSPDGPGQMPYGYEGYGVPGSHAGPLGHAHAPGFQGPQGYPGPQGHLGAQGYPAYPGYPYQGAPGYGWPAMPVAPANGMGVTGLVLGIIAAAGFCLWPLAIVLGILAVIFGAVGRGKARRGEATNGGQALAGIICGAAGIVLGVALLVITVVLSEEETDTRSLEPPARATTSTAAPAETARAETAPSQLTPA